MTEIVHELDESTISKIVRIIDNGGIISFPTETVYALVTDASNFDSVNKIYQIKKRFNDKALPILVGDIYQAKRIAEFNDRARKLAFRLFPGPITLVLKLNKHHNLASNFNQNLETVGIRMPNNLTAIKILKAVGRPLIGTSANISTQASALSGDEVLASLGNQIDLIIDKGKTDLGIASTIVDLTQDQTKILRIGAIPKDVIQDILGEEIS